MKNLRQIMLLVMAVATVSLTSCSKDDDGGSGGGAAQGTIVAKVDGTSVTTIEMATFAHLVSGNLQIQGNTGGTSSKAFMITIIGFDGVGTYPIGGGANIFNIAAYVETEVDLSNPTQPDVTTWQAPYDDTEVGEIKISEITSTHIIGTFKYKAKTEGENYKDITEGSFNIELQEL